MKDQNPDISKLLDPLKETPEREPRAAARGRAQFIARIAELQPVSERRQIRHNLWKVNSRKERLIMNLVIALVVAFVMALGGGGVVYASQDDLPGEPLYGVKLFMEDVQLSVNSDPQAKLTMLMEMTQRRVEEITALASQGEAVPQEVQQRLEAQLQQALQTAAGMGDAQMLGALQQIQSQVQLQMQVMTVLQNQAQGETRQAAEKVRLMLETRLRQCDEGLADLQGLRNTLRNEAEIRQGQTETPAAGSGTPQGPSATEQGSGNGEGQQGPAPITTPDASTTPTGEGPNGSQGPGPSCTPTGQGPFGTPGGQGGGTKP